jgi:hypothetical protein
MLARFYVRVSSMIRRRGEGFTPYEDALLGDFLDDEIALHGLFQLVARKATVSFRSDVYTRIDEGSAIRVVTRNFVPVPTPGLDPAHPKRKRSVILSDVTSAMTQVVGSETTLTTEWYCKVGVREGRKTQTDVRPTLLTWQYIGAPALTATPELGGEDWVFANPGEVWALIEDDLLHREQLDRQATTIRELQRVHVP